MLRPDIEHLFPGRHSDGASTRPTLAAGAAVVDGSVRRVLTRALRTYLADRTVLGYNRFVVGLSGGVDSAVCARLAQDALPGASHGVIIDFGDASDEVRIAEAIARKVGMPHTVLDGRAVYGAHRSVVPEHRLISRIHLRSRLISSMLFQFADNCDGLVVDTTDRSEQILCLFEEGGRGHVAPVIDLYKSELYVMAAAMGFEELTPSGCPDLDNLDAFGLVWSELDAVLDALVAGTPMDDVASAHGLDWQWLSKLARRIQLQPLRTSPIHLGADGRDAS